MVGPPDRRPRMGPAPVQLPFSSRFARLHGRGPAGIARAKYLDVFVENITWEAPRLRGQWPSRRARSARSVEEVSKRFGK